MKKNVHVVPDKGNWAVKTENKSRAAKKTQTQAEAIETAISIAKNNKSEMVIHRKDGTIREKNSYGNDPFPPKG